MRTLTTIVGSIALAYTALAGTGCAVTPHQHYHQAGYQRRAVEDLVTENPSECRRHNFVPALVEKARASGAVTNDDLYDVLFNDREELEAVRDYASSRLAEQRLGELRLGGETQSIRPKSAFEDLRPLLTDKVEQK